jgi:hypothetical protein
VCETLDVTTYAQLEALAQVALNYPLSLLKLREVEIKRVIGNGLEFTSEQPEKEALLEMCFKVNNSALNHPFFK